MDVPVTLAVGLPGDLILEVLHFLAASEPVSARELVLGLREDAGLHAERVEALGLREIEDVELDLLPFKSKTRESAYGS